MLPALAGLIVAAAKTGGAARVVPDTLCARARTPDPVAPTHTTPITTTHPAAITTRHLLAHGTRASNSRITRLSSDPPSNTPSNNPGIFPPLRFVVIIFATFS